jgi:hypothetical protein
MTTFVLNDSGVGGIITGEILHGRDPYPWLLIRVKTICVLRDRFGKEVRKPIPMRVVLQGTATVEAYKNRLRPGMVVYARGQVVGAEEVVPNSRKVSGFVTLAHTFQIIGEDGG